MIHLISSHIRPHQKHIIEVDGVLPPVRVERGPRITQEPHAHRAERRERLEGQLQPVPRAGGHGGENHRRLRHVREPRRSGLGVEEDGAGVRRAVVADPDREVVLGAGKQRHLLRDLGAVAVVVAEDGAEGLAAAVGAHAAYLLHVEGRQRLVDGPACEGAGFKARVLERYGRRCECRRLRRGGRFLANRVGGRGAVATVGADGGRLQAAVDGGGRVGRSEFGREAGSHTRWLRAEDRGTPDIVEAHGGEGHGNGERAAIIRQS